MGKLEKKAYGKINLTLDITGVMPNGYHEINTIMQTVLLHDNVTLEAISEGIEFSCNDENLPIEDNLCTKAARLMFEKYNISGGVRIYLEKKLPVAAGMAGGSTDAAAVFEGINELFEIGASKEELCKLAVGLGADIPFCIMRGTKLCQGIGEEMTELRGVPSFSLLIAKPPIFVSTKEVYTLLDSKSDLPHPNVDAMIVALEKEDREGIPKLLGNILEEVTAPLHPVIKDIEKMMLEGGALGALMSGSGPTVFGLFDSDETAEVVRNKILEAGLSKEVYVTGFYNE